MRHEAFSFLARWLKERTGLVVGAERFYLLESRIAPVARRYQLGDLDAVAEALRQGRAGDFAVDVVDAMMTGESAFFRDGKPFDEFRSAILPGLLAARAAERCLRIWSAGCAAGQEPYSLAMILAEVADGLAGWRIEVVATDVSRELIGRAREGLYTQFEVQRGLPIRALLHHFSQEGDRWRIAEGLRGRVELREFNLLADPTALGRFDVVFCRNVLLYLEPAVKTAVLDRIARLLPPDGVLYLGASETVLGASDRFAPLPGQRGVYGLASASAPALRERMAVRA